MIPPQCGIETIGARPRTLPLLDHVDDLLVDVELFEEVGGEESGDTLPGDSGFGTPPARWGRDS